MFVSNVSAASAGTCAYGGHELLVCDLTQSWSSTAGGGISTYLRRKAAYVLDRTPHRLIQIVPGAEDRVTEKGRHTLIEVGAPRVPGSPHYRFILRMGAVSEVLARYRPDVIESLCPWLLPWAAVKHRRAFPETALVAGYRTDFPNAHIHRVGRSLFGEGAARMLRDAAHGYARKLYREFDWVYTLGQPQRAQLARLGITHTRVMPLGTDLALFTPDRRDPGYRAALGLPGEGPLLVYAGRLDNEKRADMLAAMFRKLPPELGAAMVMIGDGKLREQLAGEMQGLPVAFPGFEKDRAGLARALASSDIYVSGMADETFGISVIEAQAAGLPVVGVASGAMPERVPAGLGYLGPAGDADAMAANVLRVWREGPAVIGARARAHAERFDWENSFDRLFHEIYPAAMVRRNRRLTDRCPWKLSETSLAR
ncbi:glycosyltransferase [Sphingomonas sp. LB-2]|uniref:glycosyltransferase n=1 Tax=Sphingomonas caeni TaxID=2984949 RepID=UPI00222F0E6F|nr:glycosyltransferase [Sphingomonas caeni]MCW3845716.1 glycosyltransferase [Sphingomonas caeni]